ncbi:MAG: PKD domain-containing protein [Methanobacteriota archaeon]|nr:MAG: PKD domain-containing protein [Euryarchaeota archaeon]
MAAARDAFGRFACVFAALCFSTPVLAFIELPDCPVPEEHAASTMQVGEAPIAVIADLPDAVSNGTWWSLNASGSYDPDGSYIKSYLWEIEYGDVVEELFGRVKSYKFNVTGLYKIKLTVFDALNNSGIDFTAVYSVPDSDLDGVPDWWEVKYFKGLEATAEQDPDGDGYSNLEEYIRTTNPLVSDPREGIIEANWKYFLAAAIIGGVLVALLYPRHRRRKKEAERRKMEYAIEIQRALDED